MSEEDPNPERVSRSFNFRKITVERDYRGIEATKQKRMDRFQTGMEPVGRERQILEHISEQEARLLYEALGELLGCEQGKNGDEDE